MFSLQLPFPSHTVLYFVYAEEELWYKALYSVSVLQLCIETERERESKERGSSVVTKR